MPPIPRSYRRETPVGVPEPYATVGAATLHLGDCVTLLPRLRPALSGKIHLAFADPPFNIGYQYDVYNDSRARADYLDWTERWIIEMVPLLHSQASVYVATGLAFQAEIKLLLDAARLYWRDTICWHYTFGVHQNTKWTPSWVAIHYYTKDPKRWTWNPEKIRVPSLRQTKYRDRRANPKGRIPGNYWDLTYNEGEAALSGSPSSPSVVESNTSNSPVVSTDNGETSISSLNSWGISRLCGTFKERTGHPCQMPEKVLERILLASSNPDDLILDPFAGSGTTLAVAQRLNRRGVGIELSQDYLDQYVIPRLQTVISKE